MDVSSPTLALLRLTLVDGLGPATIGKLVSLAGSADAALELSPAQLSMCKIGAQRAAKMAADIRDSRGPAENEIALADKHGVRLVSVADDSYPALLKAVPDPPPILYYKGDLRAADRFALAIVGSRRCTAYGLEQTTRFAGTLARAGITIVSGGARGIDTAAHRAALMSDGRTLAVLGCGLAHVYPPENAELFEKIAGSGTSGAVISELPMDTAPDRQNFPRRNRIISALSLGVLVIEAGKGSGALITAEQAAEEHGREVFALPGRVDSPASEGSNELLKSGGAGLVTEPADVIAALESPARHLADGTHAARYQMPAQPAPAFKLAPEQHQILEALETDRSADELVELTGLPASSIRSHLTLLEISKRVQRVGSRFARRNSPTPPAVPTSPTSPTSQNA
ncbi:MAG: DNA-processing protein DprA [Phycisphaerales bacterium]|nr:DNA-protecting protein DprA [Planctomycetota bacterium]